MESRTSLWESPVRSGVASLGEVELEITSSHQIHTDIAGFT